MAHMASSARKIPTLTLCLAALCPAAAFSQVTAAPVAYVYVGTANGVYLYNAAPNGSLSPVPVGPRSVEGVAIGSNRGYFLSLDPDTLHAYTQTPDGEIRGQSWFVNTQTFSGGECGTAQGGVFDHSGQYIYVQLFPDQPVPNDQEACAAIQTFKIDGTGALSFLGATQFATEIQTGLNTAFSPLIKLSGNGSYGYSASFDHECDVRTWEFKRESSGTMLFNTYEILKVPSTPPDWRWEPFVMTADPTNHVAIAMNGQSGESGPCGDTEHLTQLASFTVASDGNLATTNTRTNMPTPKVDPEVLNMSPAGQFLAVGGSTPFSAINGTQTPGLQVFHFNGANPVTPYSAVLTTVPINDIRWDNNNHLYALSNATKKLYAYTVTASSITAVPGSPYTIASAPNALVVVPSTACSAPAAAGVHICSPLMGPVVNSPVLVQAAATVTGTIARMELWVDGVKKYTATSSKQLNIGISLAAGNHRFGVFAVNTAGQKWQSVVNTTVM